MRSYVFRDDFFLDSFNSNSKSTVIIESEENNSLFFAISKNQEVLNFIEHIKDSLFDINFLDIVKELKTFFDGNLNNSLFGEIDYKRRKFIFINFNLSFLFLKEQKRESILNSNSKFELDSCDVKSLDLDSIDMMFATDNLEYGEFFKSNFYKFNFTKEIVENFYMNHQERELSCLFFNSALFKFSNTTYCYSIKAKKSDIDKFELDLETLLSSKTDNLEKSSSAMIIFNELILNAYEHGALRVDGIKKQKLIEQNLFDIFLKKLEDKVDDTIDIEVVFFENYLLKIKISDNGSGFDYFKSANINHTDFRGRGLLMARKMSRAIFYNNRGRNSIFFMDLTPEISESESESNSPESDKLFYTKKVSILYVEDDDFIRVAFTRIMKRYSDKLFVAKDGEEGFSLYEEFKPDIIITDIEMPKINGLEMSAKIRECDLDIPIILTTAFNDEDIFLKAIDIGIDKFLVKPIDSKQLEKTLLKISKDTYLKSEAKRRIELDNLNKNRELSLLKSKNQYMTTAQQIAFEKEKLIIKDDSEILKEINCEIYYEPLEILSGDIYGVLKIDDSSSFFYIVDSMGKGLGASVTATLSASFINREFSLQKDRGEFDLDSLVFSYNEYIKQYLLAYESVSYNFIYLNCKERVLKHSSFGMYPIFIKDLASKDVSILKSNHPPLSKYIDNYKIEEIEIPNQYALLSYSDGIIEHEEYSLDDFKTSMRERDRLIDIKADFTNSLNNRKNAFEDDITVIYISNLTLKK